MKAAVLTQIGKPLEVMNLPMPDMGPEDILVRTRTCGICRTDLHIQDGLAYISSLPHIPGHEPSGVVAKIGARVLGFSAGQRVIPYLFLACGRCRFCRTGHEAQCTEVGGIIGVTRSGGFAEYFVAPARNLIPVPETVSDEAAGLASCAVITGVHAFRRARLTLGETAVVIGAGGIGLILLQLLKSAGVHTIAVDRSEASLALAAQNGADAAVLFAAEAPAARIWELSGGAGADCVFDLVGMAATLKLAADSAARQGRIVVIGEEPEFPAIDTITIAQRELEIIGSRNGGYQDAVDALEFMASGVIRPRIDRRFPLREINQALSYVRSGAAHGRVVVVVEE